MGDQIVWITTESKDLASITGQKSNAIGTHMWTESSPSPPNMKGAPKKIIKSSPPITLTASQLTVEST
eukprot:6476776-Amphidinium_carterae.1